MIGFTPAEVGRMMLWEFAACADGFAKANGAEQEPDAPSLAEHQDMLRRLSPR
ncbi:hypothetical protein [Rhizobium sp. CSW-27]|uniref:hypothetical protein n=1 Tax=Rhizobium sp. CSW-27 TaxID=2839985 RepID=UPI001C02017A|nr:hypothetical protein [Rhizobium sp. CSW-27]MBT9373180.1 hypothetical protein [Rhizobium sp. CSW-27]